MDGHRCARCHQYWASHCGPPERFEVIGYFCPMCVPIIADQRLDNAGPPPPRPQHYRRHNTGLIRKSFDTSKEARRTGGQSASMAG